MKPDSRPAVTGAAADVAVEALVDEVAEILRRQIGLRPETTLRGRLRRSMRDEAHAHHATLETYVATLTSRPGALQGLFNRVTVQETGFFRHPEHFRVLAEILPTFTAPVTLWSAACANGQEPYSLAMVLEELRIDGRVIASDMSTAALERTASARYSAKEIAGISAERRSRFFTPGAHGWQVTAAVRARVTTMQHNLLDPIPEATRWCQVVFCRNVLIYFSADQSREFATRIADTLPGAAVFLGSAEAMWPISSRFETVHTGGTFYYRPEHKRGSASKSAPESERPTGVRAEPDAESRPAGPARVPVVRRPPAPPVERVDVADLSRQGQQALASGDYPQAVVAFRKCAYLTPDDVLAHLHLGLALEASGDGRAAGRAFDTARRELLAKGPAHVESAIGGYDTTELLRLLDAKREVNAS